MGKKISLWLLRASPQRGKSQHSRTSEANKKQTSCKLTIYVVSFGKMTATRMSQVLFSKHTISHSRVSLSSPLQGTGSCGQSWVSQGVCRVEDVADRRQISSRAVSRTMTEHAYTTRVADYVMGIESCTYVSSPGRIANTHWREFDSNGVPIANIDSHILIYRDNLDEWTRIFLKTHADRLWRRHKHSVITAKLMRASDVSIHVALSRSRIS